MGRPDEDRPFLWLGLARRPMGLSHQAGQIRIADREIDIDGIDLVDLSQDRIFARTHQVARVFQPSVDPAVKRSRDLRIAQIELGQVPLGLRRQQVGLGRIPLIPPVVHVRLSGGLLLQQVGVAIQFDFGILQLGLLQQNLPLRPAAGCPGRCSAG